MKTRIWIAFFLLFVPISFAADEITILMREEGSVVSFYDDYYIFNVNGTFIFSNPSNLDLYNIEIPLNLGTLELSIFNKSSEGIEFRYNKIAITSVDKNSTVRFNYRVFGISTERRLVNRSGVLAEGIEKEKTKLTSVSIGTLQKAPLEDVATGGQINTRLVSARYQNPTTFPYYINSATVIKTATLDPNNELEKWTFTKENGQLMPGETWKIDVYDRNAFEGEIYWLSSDMYIRDIFYNESSNFSFFTQDDLFKLEDNSTNVTEELITSLSYLSDRVFLTKRISSKVVNPGDVVTVTLLANNFATAAITGVAVEDTIPEGFEFVDSRFGTADDRKISWTNVTLNSKETRRIEYKIRYTDEDAVGIDYFSAAKLMYGNKEVYSQAIPYIRSYIPKKQLFVQKSINFISDDEVRVDITLQNVGESHIDSIVLNDYLAPNSEFREITQTFTNKGVWKIDRIEKDSTWEVSYVTDSVGVLNTFPVVFGIEDKSVLKTVILSNIISTNLQISTVRFVEIGGIIALLIIGVLFFLPYDSFNFAKRREINEVKNMDNELTRLMVQSEPHHRTGQPHKPTQIHPSNPQQQVPGQKQQIEDEINRTTQDIQHMRDRFKTK